MRVLGLGVGVISISPSATKASSNSFLTTALTGTVVTRGDAAQSAGPEGISGINATK
jgi:hypothetical protein